MELTVITLLVAVALVTSVMTVLIISYAIAEKSKIIGLLAALEGVVSTTIWVLLFNNIGGLFT